MRAQFEVVSVTDKVVTIRDLNGPMSITNDAENVLAWAKANYPGKDLHYYDSYGDKAWIKDQPVTTWLGTSPVTFKFLED